MRSFAMAMPVRKLSEAMDKRATLITLLLVSATGCIPIKLNYPDCLAGVVAMTFVPSIGNSGLWQLMPVMIYDIFDYDEYENNKRREGIVVSIQNVMETVCSGLSTLLFGWILQIYGFVESIQVETKPALDGCGICIHSASRYPDDTLCVHDI